MFAIIWKRNMLCNWDKITYWRIFAQWYKVERENFQMITEPSVCDRNFSMEVLSSYILQVIFFTSTIWARLLLDDKAKVGF